MTAEIIACTSRIERVVVYARGAVVTRRLEIAGPLPAGPLELSVPGITPLAEAGSFRALLDAPEGERGPAEENAPGREVIGIRARLVVPPPAVVRSSLPARLSDLGLALERLSRELENLRRRRELLGSVSLEPKLTKRIRPVDPKARIQDALAVSGLLSEELSALDTRIAAVVVALERARREHEALRIEAAQATSAELGDQAPPRLDVRVRLSPNARAGAQTERGPTLRLEYAVLAARWWPAYAARFSRGATQVAWQLDAFVAQASGEDWNDVGLALSTADLVQDTRLPELASLRLSRAQRPPRRGFRPAPEGLDAMFEGFDRFVAAMPRHAPGAPAARAALRALVETGAMEERAFERTTVDSRDLSMEASMPLPPQLATRALMSPVSGGPPPGAPPFGAPPAPSPMAFAQSMPAAMARKSRGLSLPSFGAAGGAPQQAPGRANASTMASRAEADEGAVIHRSSGGDELEALLEETHGGAAATEAAIEPADGWLDFDALRLPGAVEASHRGRLSREDAGRRGSEAARAGAEIDALEPPPRAVDPRASRGQFDHRYDAEGTVDVPSNARLHRVTLGAALAASTPRFVAVPREAAEVYREALVRNPFVAPLLAGPVEIFVDGALTAQTAIGHVDRGGMIRAGLGVEDRVRVVRNARVDESSAGLLGGSLAVEHAVSVDLSSSLGRPVEIEVIDRIPVTEDKDLDIKLVSSQPKAQAYTQEDLGEPVRGGLRWVVPLPPGGKASVAFTYRVTLPSKNELIGGNRRE